MPRKCKHVYLSDLKCEPESRCSSRTSCAGGATNAVGPTALRDAVDSLSQRERIVIVQRFGLDGLPATLDAIGRTLGCTRECVRKVEVRALRKLRSHLHRPSKN
jgi:DNA-directed RNA polymerase sigma subunit (sigma70/sigma32)